MTGVPKIVINNSSIRGVFILIIMFWGEPDIHDAIIKYLMSFSGGK